MPPDALDLADYGGDVDAWLDAMEAENKPGRVRSGTYPMPDAQNRRLYTSIYGCGATRPVFEGAGRRAWLYLDASGITIQYVRFEDIDQPILWLDDWTESLGTSSQWHRSAWSGPAKDGDGLVWESDIEDISVLDCEFEGAGVAVMFIGDRHRVLNVHIGRNVSRHGSGFFTAKVYDYDHIYIYQNDIRDHDQGTAKGNHVGTLAWLGTNDLSHIDQNHVVRIEHNEADGVTSSQTYSKINAAVFADVRDSTDAFISWNLIRNMLSSAGHSDANALYSKSNEVYVEHNIIENCGANANDIGEGSEGAHITFKGGTGPTWIRHNHFYAGTISTVSLILSSHDTIIEDNDFYDWQWDGFDSRREGLIRTYSGGPLTVINPTFHNCGVAGGTGSAYAVKSTNNYTTVRDWVDVDFDGDRTEIFKGVDVIENATNVDGEPLVNAP